MKKKEKKTSSSVANRYKKEINKFLDGDKALKKVGDEYQALPASFRSMVAGIAELPPRKRIDQMSKRERSKLLRVLDRVEKRARQAAIIVHKVATFDD